MGLTVLHVYKDVFPEVPGGIERHVDELRRNVRGVTSNVLVCSRSRRARISAVAGGVEVAAGELGRLFSAPIAPTFPFWLRRLEADLIHVHMPNPTGELSALLAAAGRPIVASYHADVVRQAKLLPVYGPVVKSLLSRAKAVISGTDALVHTSRMLNALGEKVQVIPYAVDTVRLDPAQVAPSRVEALKRRFGPPIVVATGRLVYYKGFDRLIRLSEEFNASLVIAGTGPLERDLRSLAVERPRVHMLGRVSDTELRELLAAADVFVLPSVNRAESFGIATIEAQSMGVPAVVSDVGTGTVEAVDDGVTGLVVPAGDDRLLVQAVRRLLEARELRQRFSAAARKRAIDSFSVQSVAEKHAALYRRVLEDGSLASEATEIAQSARRAAAL